MGMCKRDMQQYARLSFVQCLSACGDSVAVKLFSKTIAAAATRENAGAVLLKTGFNGIAKLQLIRPGLTYVKIS